MNIIYASCLCSNAVFRRLFSGVNDKPGQQVQKYHRLLTQGLALNGASVNVISALPVNRSNSSKKYVSESDDFFDGVSFNYISFLNIPVVKHIIIFFLSFIKVVHFRSRYTDCVVICDVLNISVSLGALVASKIVQIPTVAVVTDFPQHLSSRKNSLFVILSNFVIKKCDSYILLTSHMVDALHCASKPYVIIEGLVDIDMTSVGNNLSCKADKKICLYAGAVDRRYGVDTMVWAFIKANIADAELHIYGSGDFSDELISICEIYSNVKYFGIVFNDRVVREQVKATLLINPRPAFEDFTKFSFPSKIMEYLASGTPAVVTKLPGIPSEYHKFLFLFEDESLDTMAKRLQSILRTDAVELHEIGSVAKEFVLVNKNNRVQAKKVIEMINFLGI